MRICVSKCTYKIKFRNNPIAMMAEFRKFAANMTPQRAQQQVEKLLADGTMSQDQFQQLQQQAKDFLAFLGK